eukprot:scaffold70726_cov62-Phaeocystis_antarctica.AAC.2
MPTLRRRTAEPSTSLRPTSSHASPSPGPHHGCTAAANVSSWLHPAPVAALAVAVGASQRQTVAVGPSRPTGPLGPNPPYPRSHLRPNQPSAATLPAVALAGPRPQPPSPSPQPDSLRICNQSTRPHSPTVLLTIAPAPFVLLAEHYEQRCRYVFDVLPESVFPDGGCVREVGH